jgi:DNA-binding beta-propeller fold protein YncE
MELPAVIPDQRWGHLLMATRDGTQTRVRRLDVASGAEVPEIVLDGHWRLPTIGSDPVAVGRSADGSTLALVEDPGSGTRTTSRFAVVDLSGTRPPKVIALSGVFDFDAISPDGTTLFVVERKDSQAGGLYQVRALDSSTGLLAEGAIVDKSNPGDAMAGWAIEQQRLAGGIVMTLYRGHEHPFVHALDTLHQGAVCIDLPPTMHDDAVAAADWGLARSPDGLTIYAVNATIGSAVDIDPFSLSVRRVSNIGPSTAAITLAKFGHQDVGVTGRRVVVSPDGRRIFAASANGIVELAASDLSVSRRLIQGTRVDALGLTPDGSGLFALRHSDGTIDRLDVASGAVVARVPGSGYDRLLAVVPLDG